MAGDARGKILETFAWKLLDFPLLRRRIVEWTGSVVQQQRWQGPTPTQSFFERPISGLRDACQTCAERSGVVIELNVTHERSRSPKPLRHAMRDENPLA